MFMVAVLASMEYGSVARTSAANHRKNYLNSAMWMKRIVLMVSIVKQANSNQELLISPYQSESVSLKKVCKWDENIRGGGRRFILGGGGGGGGTKGITRQMTSLEKVRELDEDICKVELMSRPVLNTFRAGFYVSNEVNFSKLLR